MTESPTAHQGRLRFARRYPSRPFAFRARRSPSTATKVRYATTISQFSGCMSRLTVVSRLEQPEEQQRHELDRQDGGERSPEAGGRSRGGFGCPRIAIVCADLAHGTTRPGHVFPMRANNPAYISI